VPHRSFAGDPTPVHGLRQRRGTEGRLCLLVIDKELVATYPLPDGGSFVIGRSEDADICVDAPLLSRRHALLHISSKIRLQDLNSANGTRVHNRRLDPGDSDVLVPGDMFELGSTMFVLQSTHVPLSPRRIWTSEYFQSRVEEECGRAEMTKERFAILRFQVRDKKARAEAMHRLLLASLQPADVIARDGPDCFQALLIGPRAESARSVVESIARAASQKETPVRAGAVFYPDDGRSPDALLTKLRCEVSAVAGPTRIPLVVESSIMHNLHQLVERVAGMPINVLLLGETGVGKEVFAERLHTLSPRVAAPLLRINCASLPAELLESQLFGHIRGAFTTAHEDREGLLEAADQGSLFLDEMGEMPLQAQAKLLRFLDERSVRRLGAIESTPVDVRIIAATNRDLEAEVAAGRFRQDLYFRLNGISIVIPSLRDRPEEVGPLAQSFATQASRRFGRPATTISPAALHQLQQYAWPGNVRELRNVIERAIVICKDTIEPTHLALQRMTAEVVTHSSEPSKPLTEQGGSLVSESDRHLRQAIVDALSECGGNQTKAAKMLGISRNTLASRIDKFGLPRPRSKRLQRETLKPPGDGD